DHRRQLRRTVRRRTRRGPRRLTPVEPRTGLSVGAPGQPCTEIREVVSGLLWVPGSPGFTGRSGSRHNGARHYRLWEIMLSRPPRFLSRHAGTPSRPAPVRPRAPTSARAAAWTAARAAALALGAVTALAACESGAIGQSGPGGNGQSFVSGSPGTT